MKSIILTLLLIAVLSPKTTWAQQNSPESEIHVIGRYISETSAVELRFFSQNKSILYHAMNNGYVIERAQRDTGIFELKFEQIAKVFPYNENEWNQVMNNEKDPKRLSNLELAKEIYESRNNQNGGELNLEGGIQDLKNQMSNQGFEYLTVVMTAMKDNNVAKALGFSYLDTSVSKNKTYFYRINLLKPHPVYEIHSTYHEQETTLESAFVKRKIYTKEGDKELSFLWEENDIVSGVLVERRVNEDGQFKEINTVPMVNLSNSNRNGFNDVGLVNYTVYEYRFYGYNAFGEKVLFGEAKGMPRDLIAPSAPIVTKFEHSSPNEITLEWRPGKENDPDLYGFIIARGEKNRGSFTPLHNGILPQNTLNFVDTSFSKEKTNYYVIQSIDTAGNVNSTDPIYVTIIDSVPPQKPVILTSNIDSNGVVTLKIDSGIERDLMGYRILRSNSDKHEFSVIQERFIDLDSVNQNIQTEFLDSVSLKTTTPYVYYRVVALDHNFNQSVSSEILKVKRPDNIAPVAPLVKHYAVSEKSIFLQFVPSSSKDVVSHTLLRREDNTAEWDTLTFFEKDASSYTDTAVKSNQYYEYTMYATDDDKNNSVNCKSVRLRPYPTDLKEVFKPIATHIADSSYVVVDWTSENQLDSNGRFVLMKKENNGDWTYVTNTQETVYRDYRIKENSILEYRLKYFTDYSEGIPVLSNVVSLD